MPHPSIHRVQTIQSSQTSPPNELKPTKTIPLAMLMTRSFLYCKLPLALFQPLTTTPFSARKLSPVPVKPLSSPRPCPSSALLLLDHPTAFHCVMHAPRLNICSVVEPMLMWLLKWAGWGIGLKRAEYLRSAYGFASTGSQYLCMN